MVDFEVLAAQLDKLSFDPEARRGYDLFAGGLTWSDEFPDFGLNLGLSAIGYLRRLWNYRSSLILGEPREEFRGLWDRAVQLCPNWPGFLPDRRDAGLACECRERALAANRSWEELDAQYERQKKAKEKEAVA